MGAHFFLPRGLLGLLGLFGEDPACRCGAHQNKPALSGAARQCMETKPGLRHCKQHVQLCEVARMQRSVQDRRQACTGSSRPQPHLGPPALDLLQAEGNSGRREIAPSA